MARHTRSKLGIVPENSKGGAEFRHRYRFSKGEKREPIKSLFSSEYEFVNDEDPETSEKNLGSQFKSPLDFESYHHDERYDLSTSNIIDQLKNTALRLKYSDFVYCKNYGVYPNNRLIIVRRFSGPVGDNLTRARGRNIATLVTWFDDSNPPITIDFGINWQDAEVSFKNVLNNIGTDIGLTKIGISLGDAAAGGFRLLPLPGAFEPLTRSVINSIFPGTFGDPTFIPAGSPTLIKEAKQRKLIPDDQSGSSLNGKITVAVKCTWEQKFIGGIDPTPVYYDLLRTILHFGSDNASFYMGGGAGIHRILNKLLAFLKDPMQMIKKILEGFSNAISSVMTKIKEKINQFYDSLKQKVELDTSKPDNVTPQKWEEDQAEKQKNAKLDEYNKTKSENKKNEGARGSTLSLLSSVLGSATTMVTSGLANKYKHVLLGITNALSGAPSTPWHVTVGSPFRPILSSGDMYMQSIKLTLGANLAFNDLPSSIEVEFTLESARNLGANEIFRKLTTGEVRFSAKIPASFYEDFADGGTYSGGQTADQFNSLSLEVGPISNEDPSNAQRGSLQPYQIDKSSVGNASSTGVNSSNNGQQVNRDPNQPGGPIQQVNGGGTPLQDVGSSSTVQAAASGATVSSPPPGPTPERPVNFEYRSTVDFANITVTAKNNGVEIASQKYSAVTFTIASAEADLKFRAENFGLQGPDGRLYQQGQIPK